MNTNIYLFIILKRLKFELLFILFLIVLYHHSFFVVLYLYLKYSNIPISTINIETNYLCSLLFYDNWYMYFDDIFYNNDWFIHISKPKEYITYYTIYPSYSKIYNCFYYFYNHYLVYEFPIYNDHSTQLAFLHHLNLILDTLYEDHNLTTSIYDYSINKKLHFRFFIRYYFINRYIEFLEEHNVIPTIDNVDCTKEFILYFYNEYYKDLFYWKCLFFSLI